jgi:undecaprenyl-diphosphatase
LHTCGFIIIFVFLQEKCTCRGSDTVYESSVRDTLKKNNSKVLFMTQELTMALAAVQLITESLPISSTGHVQLLQLFLQRWGYDVNDGLSEALDHGLHGPMLFILAVYFRKQWVPLARATVTSLAALIRSRGVLHSLTFSQRKLLQIVTRIAGMVVVADITTALGYFLFKNKLQALTGNNIMLLACGFAVTMLVLWSIRWRTDSSQTLSYSRALLIGSAQGSVALLPGISRFASTVVCARWLGISQRRSLQFSFLMFAPLMLAAFVVHGIPAMLMNVSCVAVLPWVALLGGATLLAYPLFAMSCWLLSTNRWWWLGYYMTLPIAACLVLWLL